MTVPKSCDESTCLHNPFIPIPPKYPPHRAHEPLEQHAAYPTTSSAAHPLVRQIKLAHRQAVDRVLRLRLRLHLPDRGQDYDTLHDES